MVYLITLKVSEVKKKKTNKVSQGTKEPIRGFARAAFWEGHKSV